MKTATANAIRSEYIAKILELFATEDTGMVTSNSFNFPIVKDDEEGWVEVIVKVPKYSDEEGYELREDYKSMVAERLLREQKKAATKKEKGG